MNRRRITIFAMLAAVTIIAAVFASFLVTGSADRNVPPIVLPPEVSGKFNVGPGVAGEFTPAPPRVSVTAENLADIIATLERPAGYAAEFEVTLYWSGRFSATRRQMWVSGQNQRIQIYDVAGNPTENVIIANGLTYVWREGDRSYYKGATGEFSGDDAAGVPTYEDIAAVPPGDILDCYYAEFDGKPCVYAETGDALGQTAKWWVVLDDGLLWKYEMWSDGEIAISCTATAIETGDISTELFRLPDGNLAIEP